MNAPAKPKPASNQVVIRPERLVCVAQEGAGQEPDRPYSRFQRWVLTVVGVLRGRKLI
jgi:hypothetical protein